MPWSAATWEVYNGELHILAKEGDEWRRVKPPIRPYFFVRESSLDSLKKACARAGADCLVDRGDYVAIDGHRAARVEVRTPDQVKKVRDALHSMGVPTYEADVKFVYRVMIDTDMHASKSPKILFFDVEADARKGVPRPEDPELVKQRVLSIAAVDESGRDWFFCDDDERVILRQFAELALKYDILMGWNTERFDVPYLEHHYAAHGMRSPFRYVSSLDFMEIYKELYWIAGTVRLDDVAERELGVGKALDLYEHGGAQALWEWFTRDRGMLYEYNVGDALILWKLFEKYEDEAGLKDLIVSVSTSGYTFYDSFYYRSRIIDTIVLRKSMEKSPRLVLPTKRKEEHKDIPGALILDPVPGLYRYVLMVDFASLYPTIIMSFNISPEVQSPDGDIRTAKLRFMSEPRGLLPTVLERLTAERMKWKEALKKHPEGSKEYMRAQAMQGALKILINSMYGVMAHEGFRLFYPDVAASVTTTGQALLQIAVQVLRDMGFKVLYGDTDSLFIWREDLYERFKGDPNGLREFGESVIAEAEEELKRRVIAEFNVPEKYYCIKLDVEKAFDKLFLPPVKKRYVGKPLFGIEKYTMRSRSGHGIVVKGFEAVRGDIPNLIKKVELDLFSMIVEADSLHDIRSKVERYLEQVKQLLFSGVLDEDLVMKKTVSKPFDKYKSVSVHVKAAMKAAGRVRPGESVYYVVVGEGDGGLVAAPVEEGKPIPKPDYRYYWERVLDAVERILGYKPTGASLAKWMFSNAKPS